MPGYHQFEGFKPTNLARPYCKHCRSPMMLVSIDPASPGVDLHTFECSVCEHEFFRIRTLRFSEAVERAGYPRRPAQLGAVAVVPDKTVHLALAVFIACCLTTVLIGTAYLTNEIWLAKLRAAFGS